MASHKQVTAVGEVGLILLGTFVPWYRQTSMLTGEPIQLQRRRCSVAITACNQRLLHSDNLKMLEANFLSIVQLAVGNTLPPPSYVTTLTFFGFFFF